MLAIPQWAKHLLGSYGADSARYVYQDLPTHDHIRLLDLLPGDFDSDIEIRLRTARLDDVGAIREYVALSYTWGSEDHKADVTILHKGRPRLLKVTQNCAEALRYLRLQDQSRTLWVDAICIDQGLSQRALRERGSQVMLMAKIYSQASRVVAWLGPATDDVEPCLQWIKDVNAAFTMNPSTGRLQPVIAGSSGSYNRVRNLVDPRERQAFYSLITRPWFSRLWIWQEIHSGHDRSTLQLGSLEIPWTFFRVAIGRLQAQRVPPSTLLSFSQSAWIIRLYALCHSRRAPLPSTLDAMRECSCADARDRIYTAQNLAARAARSSIMPDYNASWQKCFGDSMRKYIQAERDIQFLRYVTESPHLAAGLPSWVPDWRTPRLPYQHLGPGYASGPSRASIVLENDERLSVKGIMLGTVSKVLPSTLEHYGIATDEDTTALRRLVAFLPDAPDSDTFTSRCKALFYGQFVESYASRADAKLFRPIQSFVDGLTPVGQDFNFQAFSSLNNRQRSALHMVASRWHNRAVYLATDLNHLGIGPTCTQEGDIIAALLGLQNLIMLRPFSNGCYTVVGETQCGGFLCGEAVLGPLPEHFEYVRASYEVADSRWIHAFRDKRTQKIQSDDPRLPARLPQNWSAIQVKAGVHDRLYRNVKTGEERGRHHDPRCDVDALERRGVKLVTFTLV